MKTMEPSITSTGWDSCLSVLQRWISEASAWDEDGLTPPSNQTIRLAETLIDRLRDAGFESPTRVVPYGEGGLVLERRDGIEFKAIRLAGNGVIEFYSFQDSQLVDSFIVDIS